MKIPRFTVISILASIMLISCSSISPLSEEEASMLIEGTVFEPDETEKTVYVPVETVRYIIADEETSLNENEISVDSIEGDETPGDFLTSSVSDNTVTVSSSTDFTNAIVEYNFLDGKIYEIFSRVQLP